MKAKNRKEINRGYLKAFADLGACMLVVVIIYFGYVEVVKVEAELRENKTQINNKN